nr:MAG: ABC transporter ATP-binding protein [Pseudomonadota bacterium]
MPALIEAEALKKSFGSIKAVDGISLTVMPGEVLGFLGPNGAGKSTTMKMITGFLEPDSGTARIAGHDVQQEPLAAKARLGYLPEGAPAYAEMTPAKFLRFIAAIRGFRGAEAQKRIDAAVEKTGLHSVLDQTIETLSKGFKRRVGIAQAILHDPDVLIMDEPTDGLDPNQKHQVRELIREMARSKAIIVSTHILEEVEAVCSRAVVIDKGRIVADGTAEDLRQRAPNHGAIAIRVASSHADLVRQTLERFSSIAAVETVSKVNGHLQLRALPKVGMSIAAEVTQAIRESAIAVEEIYVERGKLDDVFRQITTSDQGDRHA